MPASLRIVKLTPFGDAAVLIEVGDDPVAVRWWVESLAAARLIGIVDVVPAYTTVAVFYDPVQVSKVAPAMTPHAQVCAWLEELQTKSKEVSVSAPREQTISVCYEEEFAPDLGDVAARAGLTPDEVIRLHSGATYEVRAIGFSPGFPYLAGLPPVLHTPRRPSPRTIVPAGSVGIGGAQTGVYSLATPGGWNLIGRTPLNLFDVEKSEPALLRVGDRVRFQAITKKQFATWPS